MDEHFRQYESDLTLLVQPVFTDILTAEEPPPGPRGSAQLLLQLNVQLSGVKGRRTAAVHLQLTLKRVDHIAALTQLLLEDAQLMLEPVNTHGTTRDVVCLCHIQLSDRCDLTPVATANTNTTCSVSITC